MIKKNMIFIIFLVLTISVLSLSVVRGLIPMPIWVRHIFHQIITPKDLYQPIVIDNFLFFKKNFSKTYLLQPKYLDIYEIGFFSDTSAIPSKYKFKGKIKAEFFWKGKFLFDELITSINNAWYANGDMTKYKEVSLMSFEIPLQGKYKNDISVKLTVLEPDQELENYQDSIKLHIVVSAAP